MNPTLYLSCLVVIVGSLGWTARAAPVNDDQKFNSELTRLKNVYGSDSVNQFTRINNIPELAKFYEEHGNRLQLTTEERAKADKALKDYKEQEAKTPLVEGVPAQGFWWLFIPAATEILIPLIQKAISG